MWLSAILALSMVTTGDAHGYLYNPPSGAAAPIGKGPKTYQPVELSTWTSCNSSAQPDLGKGSQGYQTFLAGANVTITWDILVQHLNPPDDLITSGVSFYWKDNTNLSDAFLLNNILGNNTLTSGPVGFHTAQVPMPNRILTDATLLWMWLSQDTGYYFGCGDFKTIAAGPTSSGAPTTSSSPTTMSPTPSTSTKPSAAPSKAPSPMANSMAEFKVGSTLILLLSVGVLVNLH